MSGGSVVYVAALSGVGAGFLASRALRFVVERMAARRARAEVDGEWARVNGAEF